MARKKRQYESTRIKLDMSFEEALARLCQASSHIEPGAAKAVDTKETPVELDSRSKKTEK